jgi:hypothetical protein
MSGANSQTVKKCRTCKWFGKQPDKNGRVVPRKGDHCRCTVPLPLPPAMPASVKVITDGRTHYGSGVLHWPSSGGYMGVDAGEGCTFHEARIK